MEAHKIAVKFYAQDAGALTDADFVPVFHTWIQHHAVANHTLIDVADYAHVHHGPGTLLVAHEANFYLDHIDGSLGLTYSRKQPLGGMNSFVDRVNQAIVAALEACQRLEADPKLAGRIKFRTDEVVVFINDRLLAPNTPPTFQLVKPELEEVAARLFGGANVDVEHYASPETVFEVHLRGDQSADVSTMLNRLSAAAL